MADYDIAPTPNKTIACQVLLKDGACVHSGWLRRQSLRNKLKIFAWTQVYVVVSGGCVYCYSSEVSRKPASAFSLYGYDKVFRAGEITSREATWVFKVVHVNPDYRSYLFSSSSEKEMHYWMKIFKQEMLRASGKLPRSQGDGSSSDMYAAQYQDAGSRSDGSLNSQDYMEIEANIYEDSRCFVLPANYKNKREDEASDDEMDTVVRRELRDPRDRPPQPPPVPDRTTKMMVKSESSTGEASGRKGSDTLPESGRKGKTRSKTAASSADQGASIIAGLQKQAGTQFYSGAASPQKVSQEESASTSSHDLQRGNPDGRSMKKKTEDSGGGTDVDSFWSSIYFHEGREKASEIIRELKDEGVYLVRVNPDNSMVLHVYGDGQSRKFQIFHENQKYTLQKTSGNYFNTVPELVYFYYTSTLPNIQVCLTECYIYHPDYPSLQIS